MKRLWVIIFVLFFLVFPGRVSALECEGDPPAGDIDKINEYIDACNQKIATLKSDQVTLKQAISTINSKLNLARGQISQTEAQISNLEEEITVLTGVLDTVSISMDELSQIYLARVRESYRRSRIGPIDLIFSSSSFSDYFSRMKYLNTIKNKDQLILYELESSRLDYDARKQEKVKKQEEIESLKNRLLAQKRELDGQQAEKQNLLVITQNDEKKFQALLASARSELEAIEAIIAGRSDETEVGDVSSGQKIANVIQGASCNSSGAHLHFIVSKDGTVQNPFNFLKSVDYENCSGSSCGSSDGDSFNPSGSWDWPVSPKISFNQGYGSTWAVSHTYVGRIYKFHNGIDIDGSSSEVKAVQAGKLFRGSYSGGGGCALKYVRVQHKEGGLDTFYLHVNYF